LQRLPDSSYISMPEDSPAAGEEGVLLSITLDELVL
jgi:hypothetical protein